MCVHLKSPGLLQLLDSRLLTSVERLNPTFVNQLLAVSKTNPGPPRGVLFWSSLQKREGDDDVNNSGARRLENGSSESGNLGVGQGEPSKRSGGLNAPPAPDLRHVKASADWKRLSVDEQKETVVALH